MDFASILTMITNFFSSIGTAIPQTIFGIDTVFIGLGLVVLIVIMWMISKAKKATPKRELQDLLEEEEPEDITSDEAETEVEDDGEELEDGFMPSNISSEDQEIPAPQDDKPTQVEEAPKEVEASVEEAPATAVRKVDVVRKKRESTRAGRKISKADFADFTGHRLLIAEDNLINQKVINGVLNESGIDIVMADDGQFVMDILEEDNNFEIILMDAHMPRVDGFEATRLIRDNPNYNKIAVVALSGDTAVDDIRRMSEAGMEEHLEKPLKMDALYDVMSMYFSMQESAPEVEVPKAQVEELEISVDIDDLPCLDYDQGLDICGNDEAMYKELLKEFFIGYKDSSKKMREALVKKDYVEAQNILIDVKGTASNLGAVQFITITEHFLQAIANDNKAAYGQIFKDYQSYLLALLKSIQAAFQA